MSGTVSQVVMLGIADAYPLNARYVASPSAACYGRADGRCLPKTSATRTGVFTYLLLALVSSRTCFSHWRLYAPATRTGVLTHLLFALASLRTCYSH